MKIGELAALVGVSTRTVRHYHHLGLLPEPERLPNGYREYRLRDAVLLARVRRLAELGLALDEIRDVLADDQGKELREVLLELDADLAGQQEAIRLRRERLAALLAEADLHPDSAVSPAMASVLRGLPSGGSKFADFDREMLALVDTTADPGEREAFAELLRPLTTPEALARGEAIYARIDELAEAAPDDPRVAELAADIADHLPEEMKAMMLASVDGHPDTFNENGRWLSEMSLTLSPAQAEVFHVLMTMLKERS
ncbi:MerR family transcriptional regulator [Actinomadura rudentiformis]|uniref:MerR family transcriptional regulator n=1 Tax=Actinomadura rudentiformis TaxID=359158 RepID=A0A6H9YQ74_9ACTN|nr:MerR family transcriptional regulator [Actinomadura rudentiformis]KAB2341338.1 MerR family transcriptional regulator [Actinomadura rudentiformis]